LRKAMPPQFRAEAAQAHRRAAGVYHMLGQSEDALNSLSSGAGV